MGEIDNIHPGKKEEVGRRLALLALARTYGQNDLVSSGPVYKSMAVDGGKVRLKFESVGGGLASRDGKPLEGFEVAGDDKKFVPAAAEIDGESVVASADGGNDVVWKIRGPGFPRRSFLAGSRIISPLSVGRSESGGT